jgi:hypothetical protein
MSMNTFFDWLLSKDHPTQNSHDDYKARLANLEQARKVQAAESLLKGTGRHVVDCDQADKLLKGSR